MSGLIPEQILQLPQIDVSQTNGLVNTTRSRTVVLLSQILAESTRYGCGG